MFETVLGLAFIAAVLFVVGVAVRELFRKG